MSKQVLADLEKYKDELQSNNAKIEVLKKQLRVLTDDFYLRAYKILCEIVRLRKMTIKGYTVSNLSREEGIELTQHQINYIYCAKYLSEKSKRRIRTGKVKSGTVLYLIRQDLRFRNPVIQDRTLKKMMDGELKIDEVARMKEQLIFDNVDYDEETVVADKSLLNIIYNLNEIRKSIEAKRNLFSSLSLIKSAITQAENVEKELDIVRRLGKKIRRNEKQTEEFRKEKREAREEEEENEN